MRILQVVAGVQVHRRAGALARRRGRQAMRAASHGRSTLPPTGSPINVSFAHGGPTAGPGAPAPFYFGCMREGADTLRIVVGGA